MIVIHAEFPIDPDRHDEAVDLMREVAEQSRAEDGVIEYDIATDIDDPNLFRFTEQYDDTATFTAHTETDHVGELEAALPDLLAGEPNVTRFDVDGASDVEL
ncbi:antibiotic biosynthesis monooxygenase [Halorubrum sp. 48-1-W]|uniref:putative quinol monooxygenase n=1 Tax=Halorubrum sp. 48-1-W TaxID=2249761 RepID=UPI000DCEAB2D|nr:putative quinol monooxygenase [Halorubrum sp. 48-1-W]RAW47022.1 antibiotic biosynthesis monooxygenase [Halorubrum sp. 48-1-W]